MPHRALNDALKRLQDELNTAQSMDPASIQKLEALQTQIEEVLAQSANLRKEHAPHELMGRLEEFAKAFETTHPRLTLLANNLITTLSNMGI